MDALIDFLTHLRFWHWWIFAALILVGEVLTGTTYLLWPAAAAGLVGLMVLSPAPMGWEMQLFAFAGLSAVLALAGDRFVRKRWFASDKPNLNERGRQLVGRTARVTAAFVNGAGRVDIAGSIWSAEAIDETNPSVDAVVEVVDVDGSALKVRQTN